MIDGNQAVGALTVRFRRDVLTSGFVCITIRSVFRLPLFAHGGYSYAEETVGEYAYRHSNIVLPGQAPPFSSCLGDAHAQVMRHI